VSCCLEAAPKRGNWRRQLVAASPTFELEGTLHPVTTAATNRLPLTDILVPADVAQLHDMVRGCGARRTVMYPLGGQTSLDFGLPATQPGVGISLSEVRRVIDYPARDMTITVEAGLPWDQLDGLLAAQGQWLPIDAPHPQRATVGGLIATAWSGPRRYGYGTLRDYVLGISAIDATGTAFRGGGRVVKNVAGYDFCKLLIGSLGTLGIVTQVTLKVRPRPRASAFLACDAPSLPDAERCLADLVQSEATPAAVELLAGPAWHDDPLLRPQSPRSACRIVVGLEGTREEVDWMIEYLARRWRTEGFRPQLADRQQVPAVWQRLTDFCTAPAQGGDLMLKAGVRPGHVVQLVDLLRQHAPLGSIQAHAGNGIVLARLSGLPPADAVARIVRHLAPWVHARDGSTTLLACPDGVEPTRQLVWGHTGDALRVMRAVKQQFDPHGLLNPGRFVY
jgi:glycolate oxidase FAD binding subunit